MLDAALLQALARAARRPRPRSCRRAPAGPPRGARRSPRPPPPTCPPWSCRPGRCGRRGPSAGWSGPGRRELVDLHELGRLGQRRAGHAGELVVEAEVVLVGDRGERLVLLRRTAALLRLDRLVQALGPAAALEDAAGELVDDLDLAVDHRVVDVALVERLGLQRLDQVVDEVAVLGAVEVVDAEELLGLLDAALGDRDGLVLLVELVVEVGDEVLLRARVEPSRHLARRQRRRQARELASRGRPPPRARRR